MFRKYYEIHRIWREMHEVQTVKAFRIILRSVIIPKWKAYDEPLKRMSFIRFWAARSRSYRAGPTKYRA